MSETWNPQAEECAGPQPGRRGQSPRGAFKLWKVKPTQICTHPVPAYLVQESVLCSCNQAFVVLCSSCVSRRTFV